MSEQIKLGAIAVEVVQKNIKNIHLGVYPPDGKVRISAPLRMSLDTVRVFAITKLSWIKSQQQKMREQPREARREYLDRESHYVWGKRYLLKIEELDAAPEVELKHSRMILRIRPGATAEKKQDVLEAWYREQLRSALPELLARWMPRLGVSPQRVFVQKMRTRWGSCSRSGNIRLNTDLAKKPPECLEYILVHELAHILEPTHNERFAALMDQFMPKWKFYRTQLSRLPVRHEEWGY
jgi:predicted metal-dependent hydrolase